MTPSLLHACRRRTTERLELMTIALEMIRDEAGQPLDGIADGVKDASWCAGVAMSALAAVEEVE